MTMTATNPIMGSQSLSRRQFIVAGAGAVVAAGSGCGQARDLRDDALRLLGKPTARAR